MQLYRGCRFLPPQLRGGSFTGWTKYDHRGKMLQCIKLEKFITSSLALGKTGSNVFWDIVQLRSQRAVG